MAAGEMRTAAPSKRPAQANSKRKSLTSVAESRSDGLQGVELGLPVRRGLEHVLLPNQGQGAGPSVRGDGQGPERLEVTV